MTVLLDTHVLHWWSAEPKLLSPTAAKAIASAEELAVCDITWFELAWLAKKQRILVSIPIRSWLDRLSELVRTVVVTPAIADSAASLPGSFPGDPADRLIFAAAVEHGLKLVTKDSRLRKYKHPRSPVVW